MPRSHYVEFKVITFIKVNDVETRLGSISIDNIRDTQIYLKLIGINITDHKVYMRDGNKNLKIKLSPKFTGNLRIGASNINYMKSMKEFGAVFFVKIEKRNKRNLMLNTGARSLFSKDFQDYITKKLKRLPSWKKDSKYIVSPRYIVHNYIDSFNGEDFNDEHRHEMREQQIISQLESEAFISEMLQSYI